MVAAPLFPFTHNGAAHNGVWPGRPPCLHPSISIHWSCGVVGPTTMFASSYFHSLELHTIIIKSLLLLLLLNCYYRYGKNLKPQTLDYTTGVLMVAVPLFPFTQWSCTQRCVVGPATMFASSYFHSLELHGTVWPGRPPCLYPAASNHWSCTQ